MKIQTIICVIFFLLFGCEIRENSLTRQYPINPNDVALFSKFLAEELGLHINDDAKFMYYHLYDVEKKYLQIWTVLCEDGKECVYTDKIDQTKRYRNEPDLLEISIGVIKPTLSNNYIVGAPYKTRHFYLTTERYSWQITELVTTTNRYVWIQCTDLNW